jgi:hypothetical protein
MRAVQSEPSASRESSLSLPTFPNLRHRPPTGFRSLSSQADPPGQEGAHDPLADLGLGDQHGPQLVPRDDQHPGVADGPSVDEPQPLVVPVQCPVDV